MGILKGIIDRFRAMGKSEKEISGIIETAADKATANPDVTKPEKPKKPEIKIETTAEAFVEAVLRTGTTGKNGNFENEQFERCGKPQKHE